MVLLEVHAKHVTFIEFEGDPPRAIDRNRISDRVMALERVGPINYFNRVKFHCALSSQKSCLTRIAGSDYWEIETDELRADPGLSPRSAFLLRGSREPGVEDRVGFLHGRLADVRARDPSQGQVCL
jgi:hypothetical protein